MPVKWPMAGKIVKMATTKATKAKTATAKTTAKAPAKAPAKAKPAAEKAVNTKQGASNAELAKQVAELRESIEAKDGLIGKMQQTVKEKNDEIDSLKNAQVEHEKVAAELQEQLRTATSVTDSLTVKIESDRTLVDNAAASVRKAQDEAAAARAARDRAVEDLGTLQVRSEAYIATTEATLADLKKQVAQLKKVPGWIRSIFGA